MTFSVRSIDIGNSLRGKFELIIGDHRETTPLITTLWTRAVYEAQWMDALQSLADDRVDCCVLITDIQPSEDSSGVTYWVIYREGDCAYFQEHFSRDRAASLLGPAVKVLPNIPPRIQGTSEEQDRVSEWVLPIEDIRRFVVGKDKRD